METRLSVLSVNIRHDMTPLQRDHDIRVAVKRYRGIKFFQEFDHQPDKDALIRICNRNGYALRNQYKTEVPIAMPAVWDIIASPVYKLNKGRRGHNPARYLSVVLAEKNSFHVAFCNMHMQQKPYETDYNGRLWGEYFHKAQGIMESFWKSGYTLVYGGDLNKTRPNPYFTNQKTIVHNGLDHLFVYPATGVRATVLDRWVNRNLNTDHNLIGAQLLLRK